MNYYVVLGISQDADPVAIRSAFRARARQYHPDAGEGSSVDKFREILTAYGKKCFFEISDAVIIFERPSGSPSPVCDML
jgi:hypothetical protein